jgi:uncharacterized damage-inducible protein DinB
MMGTNEALLAELQQEAKTTRKLLERVPQQALEWRPHEKSMTLGRLASHLAELPQWASMTIDRNELDLNTLPPTGLNSSSVQEILEVFDKSIADASESLKGLSDQKLMELWRLRRGDKVFFELPKIAVLRSVVFNHQVHHRGQLSVYLRLQDVPVPSIYGPSADEPFPF